MTLENYTKLLNTWLSTWLTDLKPGLKETPRESMMRLYKYISEKGPGVAVLGDNDTVFRLRALDDQGNLCNIAWFSLDLNGKPNVELLPGITEKQFTLIFQVLMLCGSAVVADAFIEFFRNHPANVALQAMGKHSN